MTSAATKPTIGLALLLGALAACDGKSNAGAQVPDGGLCGNYPLCVATLMEPCIPSGSCTQVNAGDGYVRTFANGVVAFTIIDPVNPRSTERVTMTDGTSTCYTIETAIPAVGTLSLVWWNAAGATVATGVVNQSDNFIDVTCAGGGTARVTDFGGCWGLDHGCPIAP